MYTHWPGRVRARLHWQISQHQGSWASPRFIHPTGIRNAAGFDWHPATGALLFVGMERDNMPPDHNNAPDDVLVAVQQAGIDYGWPYCHWWVGWAGHDHSRGSVLAAGGDAWVATRLDCSPA